MNRRHRLILAVVLLFAGCGQQQSGDGGGLASAPARPHVLLLSLDTLRADRLGFAGHTRPTSPFLDDLARRSTVFTEAIVNTHGTTPSHATMLSGLYQESHRVGWHSMDGGVTTAVPEDLPWLPEDLRERGYQTIGITDGGNAGARFGFSRGFDHFDDRGGGVERVTRRALRQLEDALAPATDQPVFLFLHTYEIHSPYAPPEPFRSDFVSTKSQFDTRSESLVRWSSRAAELPQQDLTHASDLYDAGIRHTDSVLEIFFERLEEIGFLDHAVVIVTSDHGEEFGEHGGLLHRGHLYEELIRVPLLIWRPGVPASRREDPVSLVDLAPTVAELVGAPTSRAHQGRSLLPGISRPPMAFAQYGRELYTVRSPPWKLLVAPRDGTARLFDLASDPLERQDVASHQPAIVEELEGHLRSWIRSCADLTFEAVPTEPTAAEKRRLRKLGYL